MWVAILVLSILVLAEFWMILELVNRLLTVAKVAAIEPPKLSKKIDEPPPREERRKVFSVPIEG